MCFATTYVTSPTSKAGSIIGAREKITRKGVFNNIGKKRNKGKALSIGVGNRAKGVRTKLITNESSGVKMYNGIATMAAMPVAIKANRAGD